MTFEKFYKTSIRHVYSYFASRLPEKSVAEDLCQETYFEFYKKYKDSNFDSEESVKILYGFCRIIFKNYLRKNSKLKEVEFIENIYSEPNDSDMMKKVSISKTSVLNPLIDLLSPKLRQVIQLRFFQNLTRKESAEILNLKPKDIHTYQKRAVRKLQEIYSKQKNKKNDNS